MTKLHRGDQITSRPSYWKRLRVLVSEQGQTSAGTKTMTRTCTSIRVFASHDWGPGGRNHARVATVVAGLHKRGIDVWFDETHMRGNIISSMCTGIEMCDVVLVFVTHNYIEKVQSHDETDNVRREFMYAADRHAAKIHAIRFEDTLPPKWSGPVGMILGSSLYTNMPVIDDRSIDMLVNAIRRETSTTLWKHCTHKVSTAAFPGTYRPPPPLPRRPTSKASLKERVTLALGTMGSCRKEDEHTVEALDRLVMSVFADEKMMTIPFFEKVELVEKHLGLCKKPTTP